MTGEVQPERRTKVFPRGATGWHQIQFVVDSNFTEVPPTCRGR